MTDRLVANIIDAFNVSQLEEIAQKYRIKLRPTNRRFSSK